MHNLLLII